MKELNGHSCFYYNFSGKSKTEKQLDHLDDLENMLSRKGITHSDEEGDGSEKKGKGRGKGGKRGRPKKKKS